MNVLIIEDEKAAVRNLLALLHEVAPELEVIGQTDSITDSIGWLRENKMPELIFMDIQLADGSSFEIFNHVDISCPVIFTTAYDEYALRAFKVNSIDYLLKPISAPDIRRALEKLRRLEQKEKQTSSVNDYLDLLQSLRKQESYKTHFLIPVKGDKLLPVSVDSILFFYIDEGILKACLQNDTRPVFSQTLDELGEMLDPKQFFRVNRQFLVSRKAIRDIDLWFNGRLAVNLIVPASERILISRARVTEFKEWFTG
ncbi:MAG: LytR/AlgR family response regulator transcription factor [Bacteroidales bacterium]